MRTKKHRAYPVASGYARCVVLKDDLSPEYVEGRGFFFKFVAGVDEFHRLAGAERDAEFRILRNGHIQLGTLSDQSVHAE